jgi:hypothetical protein
MIRRTFMQLFTTALTLPSLLASSSGQAEPNRLSDHIRKVAPALEKYGDRIVLSDLWKRPGLSLRDRITSGLGWVQREGGPIEEVRAGDIVWFPPHEKHWHGASPTSAMTHIAIQESLDGKNVDWLEQVSDQQYRR